MPDFNAKMHQNRFRLGLCPRPAGGAYSAPPDPLAGFKGPASKRRRGKGGRGARPVCLLVLTILAMGLGWELGRVREGWVGGRLCEILNTPLEAMWFGFMFTYGTVHIFG